MPLVKPTSKLYHRGKKIERIYSGGVLRYNAVPPEPVDVYVIWGEGNAAGRALLANLPSYLAGPRPDAYIYNGVGFSPLEAKLSSNRPGAGGDWGPEMQLSRLATQGGKKVYFVKYAVPATPLVPTAGATWNPNAQSHFATAKNELTAALAALRAANKAPTVRGLVWGQGRQDAVAGSAQADYDARQRELFSAVRTAVGNPNLPILDTLVRTEGVTATAINAAKAAVASSVVGVRTMKTDAFEDTGDNASYNAAAQLAFGRHAYERLTGITYTRPAALPTPLFALDLSRQENWQLGALMSAEQLNDVSGNNNHFATGVLANQLQLVEGPFGEGFGVLRTSELKWINGPPNPLAASSHYTICAVISNFQNPTATGIRSIFTPNNGMGDAVGLVYHSGENQISLRQNGIIFLKSSVPTTTSDVQIIVARFAGVGGNFIRINGVETASSTNSPGHAAGGTSSINNFNGNRSMRADIPYLELVGSAMSVSQVEKLEGFLAHRLKIASLLPAAHPHRTAPPT